jgi:hypothetical protein
MHKQRGEFQVACKPDLGNAFSPKKQNCRDSFLPRRDDFDGARPEDLLRTLHGVGQVVRGQ